MEILHLHGIIGATTTIISLAGAYLALKHYLFYRTVKEKLSSRIKFVFLTDALIYLITLAFGIWALVDYGFAVAVSLQIVRIPLLLLNIIASVRLFILYKELSEER